MHKMILTFSLGAIIGAASSMTIKSLCSCRNEMVELMKTTFEKLKNQMRSSMSKVDASNKEALDEVIESIDSINEETLPNKVKKTLNRVRFTLNELK